MVGNNLRRKVDTSAINFKITAPNFLKAVVDDLDLQNENLDFEPEDEITSKVQYGPSECSFKGSEKSITRNSYWSSDELERLSSISQTGQYHEKHDEMSILSHGSTADELEVLSPTSHTGQYHQKHDRMSILSHGSTADELEVLSRTSHTGDMLPYYKHLDLSEDDRKSDYLEFIPPSCNGPVIIDSSTSSGFTGENTNEDGMDEDEYYQSSEYDMGSEEENILLASDNEVEPTEDEQSQYVDNEADNSQEDEYNKIEQPVFQDMQLRKSGLNNIIITVQRDNCPVKTDNIVSSLNNNHNFNAGKKIILQRDGKCRSRNRKYLASRSKKWEKRYEPYPTTRLFLEDIGYIPSPTRSIECSSNASTSSSESMTSYKITFNPITSNESRKCEQVEKQVQQMPAFKVPLLPPIKRPPTRPKKLRSNSSNDSLENQKTKKSSKKLPRDDDVISISASSLDHFDNDYQDSVKEEVKSPEHNEPAEIRNYPESCSSNSFVANWVSSQGHINIAPLLSTPIDEDVNKGRAYGTVVPKGGPRINFNDVPKFFAGICYHYYFNERCVKAKCNTSHIVKKNLFTRKCMKLTPDELQSVYNYSLRFHKLFQELYSILLKGFGYLKMQDSLISCIDDLFVLKHKVNFTKGIQHVVTALQKSGLTFIDSIEKISFSVGFLRYPVLAEILLNLLTENENIWDNWEIIKRICLVTKFITPVICERIISKALVATPINRILCSDIYNVIIKGNLTNLSKIDPQLLTPLKTLLKFGGDKSLNKTTDKHLTNNKETVQNALNCVPSTSVVQEKEAVVDADDRLSFVLPGGAARRDFSPAPSSNSSKSSDSKYNSERDLGGTNLDFSVPQKETYQYVPQVMNTASISHSRPTCSVPVTNLPTPLIINTAHPPPPLLGKLQNYTNNNASEINLFPERPVFGKFKYRSNFKFDESLHNLLISSREQVPMNDQDIVTLNNCIINANASGFLNLLDMYKGPTTLQHFITMCIANIKNCRELYNTFVDLIENIESIESGFKRNPLLKGVFEVIAYNLLSVFERKGLWKDARKIIETFSDWDSLITSKQFSIRKLTPMGRYILLARLLSHADAFYYVYELLQSPDLKLLESPDVWPLFKLENSDLESRNSVLTDFFKFAIKNNVEVVCDMYRKIFQFGSIYQFDAHTYFNPMLETLIDSEKISVLKHFHTDIDIFYKRMDKNTLRAFIVFMENHVSYKYKLKLYEYGCAKGIYVLFTGKESTIVVRSNMLDNELQLILHYYFQTLPRHSYEIHHNLRIEIGLPDRIVRSPQILCTCLRSIQEVNHSVKKILSEGFGIKVTCHEPDNCTVIEVSKEELKKVLC